MVSHLNLRLCLCASPAETPALHPARTSATKTSTKPIQTLPPPVCFRVLEINLIAYLCLCMCAFKRPVVCMLVTCHHQSRKELPDRSQSNINYSILFPRNACTRHQRIYKHMIIFKTVLALLSMHTKCLLKNQLMLLAWTPERYTVWRISWHNLPL